MNRKNGSEKIKTVLIVDDEPLSIKVLFHQLEHEFSIVLAHGGREALETMVYVI